MFLKEVYRHSKPMFAGFLFFIALQLAINYKGGMVFTPFFHYGMYSWVQKPQNEYWVNVVLVNGDTLRGGQYSPQGWDKIHYTLDEIYLIGCQKDFFQNQIARLYTKAGLRSPNQNRFVMKGNVPGLLHQYQFWLPGQLNTSQNEVQVYRHKYSYRFGRLIYQTADSLTQQSLPVCP